MPGSGTDGRADLPGEHGFRFFPGFYKHLPDTMRRIPFPGRPDGVAGNLVTATRALLAQAGGRNELIGVTHPTGAHDDLTALSRFLLDWATKVGVPPTSTRSSSSGCSRSSPAATSGGWSSSSARAGGSTPAPTAAATPTASSSPTGSRARWSPPARAR